MIGFGDKAFSMAIYLENKPPLAQYESLANVQPLKPGEIKSIVGATSNHWRKIFNVYAKIRYGLSADSFDSWQSLRDQSLLQPYSGTALLFDPPSFDEPGFRRIHLIAGKLYAERLGYTFSSLERPSCGSESFALQREKSLIVIPYLDYRQLTNVKIEQLVKIIKDDLLNERNG